MSLNRSGDYESSNRLGLFFILIEISLYEHPWAVNVYTT